MPKSLSQDKNETYYHRNSLRAKKFTNDDENNTTIYILNLKISPLNYLLENEIS
jgi:hypothetical protein